MKLLNKIKNILFDEEEIEIPVIEKEEKKEIKKVEEKIEETSTIKKQPVYEEYNERELMTSTPTFNFPAYDDEEKIELKKEEVKREPIREIPREESRSTRSLNILDYEKHQKKEKPNLFKQEETSKPKPFKPSPVISPVYGIIGNDGEIKTIKTSATPKPRSTGPIDVDAIRKKAYGTLEDQIASTLEKPIEEFYEKADDTKTIDELLNENKDNDVQDKLDILDEIEEELDNIPKRETPIINPDDTIESDLFNLIDSMYEKKEGGD